MINLETLLDRHGDLLAPEPWNLEQSLFYNFIGALGQRHLVRVGKMHRSSPRCSA